MAFRMAEASLFISPIWIINLYLREIIEKSQFYLKLIGGW